MPEWWTAASRHTYALRHEYALSLFLNEDRCLNTICFLSGNVRMLYCLREWLLKCCDCHGVQSLRTENKLSNRAKEWWNRLIAPHSQNVIWKLTSRIWLRYAYNRVTIRLFHPITALEFILISDVVLWRDVSHCFVVIIIVLNCCVIDVCLCAIIARSMYRFATAVYGQGTLARKASSSFSASNPLSIVL